MENRLLPILFSGPMVRAIQSGEKTQTRRVVKRPDQSTIDFDKNDPTYAYAEDKYGDSHHVLTWSPYKVGDHLYVRETWRTLEMSGSGVDGILYRADNEFRPIQNTEKAARDWVQAHRKEDKWRPSIFMPKWASRLTLEVTEVRVQRIRDIMPGDILSEGITMLEACYEDCPGVTGLYRAFAELWDSINFKRGFGWGMNPTVFAVTFERVK